VLLLDGAEELRVHERVSELMDEALTNKQTNSGKGRANKHDAELLYKLIEERLKESNKNGV